MDHISDIDENFIFTRHCVDKNPHIQPNIPQKIEENVRSALNEKLTYCWQQETFVFFILLF